jgi:hypothetical protein
MDYFVSVDHVQGFSVGRGDEIAVGGHQWEQPARAAMIFGNHEPRRRQQ